LSLEKQIIGSVGIGNEIVKKLSEAQFKK
jgi:hypothetical protein